MNTTERRVSDLLRAYGEGLEMTTQDIDRLEQGLEQKQTKDRVTRRHRATRIAQAAVAACAVTGVVLGALALRNQPTPQPVGPPPVTLTQLEGIWRVDDGSGWLWKFTADGKLVQSHEPDLITSAVPSDAIRVRPAPAGFVLQGPTDDPKCVGAWTASISNEGRLVAREPAETAACPGDDNVVDPAGAQTWVLTRVSPVTVAGAATVPGSTVWQPRPVTDPVFLKGTWLLRGTGTLLTVDARAAYAVQDLGSGAEPVTGTVTMRPDGTVTFAPKEKATCTAVYSSAVYSETELDLPLAKGSCARLGGTNDSWIRLN